MARDQARLGGWWACISCVHDRQGQIQELPKREGGGGGAWYKTRVFGGHVSLFCAITWICMPLIGKFNCTHYSKFMHAH